MPIAPAPPRGLGAAPEAYAGDNICVSFDGIYLALRTPGVVIQMSAATLATINSYAQTFAWGAGRAGEEHNVYCEETKKHHRAVLLRELTLDEIYRGLK